MDGEVQVMSTNNIIKHASEFYKNLFSLGSGGAFELDSELCPLRIGFLRMKTLS
jgi:hypothetical protein